MCACDHLFNYLVPQGKAVNFFFFAHFQIIFNLGVLWLCFGYTYNFMQLIFLLPVLRQFGGIWFSSSAVGCSGKSIGAFCLPPLLSLCHGRPPHRPQTTAVRTLVGCLLFCNLPFYRAMGRERHTHTSIHLPFMKPY